MLRPEAHRRVRDAQMAKKAPREPQSHFAERVVTSTFLVPRDNLEFFQLSADGLTQAGIGRYSYSLSEKQVMPGSGEPIRPDSSFVSIAYSGPETGKDMIGHMVGGALFAMERAQNEGKSGEQLRQIGRDEIASRVNNWVERDRRLSELAASLKKPQS